MRASVNLMAWLLRYPSRHVPRILMYHRFGDDASSVDPEAFERQLRYLKERCNVVHLSQLVAALCGTARLPANAVVLTVDDGYADFHSVAFPLLCRYRIPCTFFVATRFIDGKTWLWPDKVAWMLAQRDRFPDMRIADQAVPGGAQAAAPRLWAQLVGLLQNVAADELEPTLDRLAEQLGVRFPERPIAGYDACSWDQLRDMEASGWVEVGGHTRSHNILSRLDPKELPDEIDGCLEDLTVHLGDKRRSFCYPNGLPSDYNDVVRDAIAKSGFVSACTAFYDDKHLSDRYALRRFSSSRNFAQFYKAATGLQYWGAVCLGRNNIAA